MNVGRINDAFKQKYKLCARECRLRAMELNEFLKCLFLPCTQSILNNLGKRVIVNRKC